MLGATGSGKSFLLNFLMAHLQRYSARHDDLRSGRELPAAHPDFGGSALRWVWIDASVTINPFCLAPTPANLHFLVAFVNVLIQSGGQYTMSLADDRDLYEQIETIYALDPDQRRLLTLAQHPAAGHSRSSCSGGCRGDRTASSSITSRTR